MAAISAASSASSRQAATIAQPFVVTLSFKDGLMFSERFHYDLASLLRQIGADPIPALSGLQHRAAA